METEILHPLIKAVALSTLHIFAPYIRPFLKRNDIIVNALGGGLAITYVFLVLLPELDLGHDLFGSKIYLVVLGGFVLFYGIHRLKSQSVHGVAQYRIALVYACVYNWLIVYGMPEAAFDSRLHLALVTLAIGLHLLHTDYHLGHLDQKRFDTSGRWLIALFPLLGVATRIGLGEISEFWEDIFTALLAGSVIYSVFRQELPETDGKTFHWFVIGIVLYSAIVVGAGLL